MDDINRFRIGDLQRINIVGTSSSGKSTFGKQLAKVLGIPFIEMDALYHEPNWQEPEVAVFRERVSEALKGPAWVLDGNYHSKTHDLKWSRATMVIWLDMAFSLNLYRAVRRAIGRAWTKEELWPGTGNRESFRQTFLSTDSMILWTVMSRGRLRKRYAAIEQSPPENVRFLRLRSPASVEEFLKQAQSVAQNRSR